MAVIINFHLQVRTTLLDCKKPKLKYLLIQDTYVCAFAQFAIEGAKMKKKVRINVTQKDIDVATLEIAKGKNLCKVCPVARAVIRHKQLKEAKVSRTSIHRDPHLPGMHWDIGLPQIVTNWIIKFDNKNPVTPFNFTIEVPECLTK